VYLAQDLARVLVYLQSELPEDTVRRFFLRPATDPRDAFAEAQKRFGKNYRVLVMPHAGETFPISDAA
jgi:nickel-dependent lactate racemase